MGFIKQQIYLGAPAYEKRAVFTCWLMISSGVTQLILGILGLVTVHELGISLPTNQYKGMKEGLNGAHF
jgi:hypothetical protein